MPDRPRRAASLAALLALLTLSGACGGPSPAPPVTSASESPSASASPAESPTARSAARPVVVGRAPADLRDVDWKQVPVPGEFCGVPGLVRFGSGNEARATSTVWGQVEISRGLRVQYGDTDEDGRDEAVLSVGCSDEVTMNDQIAMGFVVYTHAGNDLAVLGSITPRRKTDQYTTLLTGAEFAPGRIIVHEKWYRPNDAHCCPSGDATTVWLHEDGRLTPGTTRVAS
ncbi:hypothetical protein AB0O68_01095 [Streptomyces sp. NPDC087512]|uniref:hypothetical protein n=1 Tax=Streptomyces sp. NPDC087512 TaxID=3155059 RepID=UPI003416D95B